jgi:hypothetical protein
MKTKVSYINSNPNANLAAEKLVFSGPPKSLSEFASSLTEDQRRILRTVVSKDPCASRLIESYALTQPGTQTVRYQVSDNSADLSWLTGGYPRQTFNLWANTYRSAVATSIGATTVSGIGETLHISTTDQQTKQPQPASELSVAVEETLRVSEAVSPEREVAPPPQTACYLLSLVLSPRDREVIVGDLIEEYRSYIIPEFGDRRASIWFWTQTARSVWPVLSRRLVKVISGAALAKALTHVFKGF